MAKTRKVIFWGREDVLGCSVEMFLLDHVDWEVVRIYNQPVENEVVDMIAREQPNVVILYQGNCTGRPVLPMRLLEACPGLKVITVSLENNNMNVYSRQEVKVKNISDLLTVVEEVSQESKPGR